MQAFGGSNAAPAAGASCFLVRSGAFELNAQRSICVVARDADDRELVEVLLRAEGYSVETFDDAEGFVEGFDPDGTGCILVLLDVPRIDELTLLERFEEKAGGVPAVVVAEHGDVQMAVQAFRAGASDFIQKPLDAEELLAAVRSAVAKAAARSAADAPEITHAFATLTSCEREVMVQMVKGRSNKLIAETLELSPRTVEIHRARVMRKTESQSLSHLVRMALKAGFEPED